MHIQHFNPRKPIYHVNYQLPVTQDHIDKAMRFLEALERANSSQTYVSQFCPIAFALKSTGRFKRIVTYSFKLELDSHSFFFDLDSPTAQLITNFDNGLSVKPMTASFYIN